MTETTGALAKALAAFQAEMPTVAKSKTANTGTYSYTYADLADVTAAAMPLLSANGLAFSAVPAVTERGYILTGVLLHESGERLEGSLPISGSTPQQMGGALTYMRRYLFGCMTGIVTDDDDDGQHASQAQRRLARKRAQAAPEPSNEPWPDAVLLDTGSGLAKAMYAAIGQAGIPEEERIEQVGLIIGRSISSTKEMTQAEARKVLDHLAAATKEPSA